MASIKRILIPTDGSDCAKKAAEYAFELAKSLNASVHCLFVFDYNSLTTIKNPDTEEYVRETSDKMVNEMVKLGEERGIAIAPITGTGDPANCIIELSEDYDLIIMGTVGRTGLAHAILGSVAEKTIRLSKCPVLVVK